jgi:hypothetical protein
MPTLVAAVLFAVFVVLNAMPVRHVDRGGGVGSGAQQISGPSRSLPATPASDRFFGVTINSTTGSRTVAG